MSDRLHQGSREALTGSPVSRRQVLRSTAVGIATAAVSTVGISPRISFAADAPTPSDAESLVAQFYKTLNEEQKTAICFSFDHPLRNKVDNNWFIVNKSIADLLSKDQRQMVRDIFTNLHTEEYAAKVIHQVETDNSEDGGFDRCAVAMFGEPGQKFEFVFTGRHVTRRCDGNSVTGEGFGGPIFYGHAAEGFHESASHKGNIYWYQALQANQVYQALDGKQRQMALREDARPERHTATVDLTGDRSQLAGIPVSELSADQKGLVKKVMADLLAPFRKADADKALAMIEAGGFDKIHMAFYNGKGMDLGNDGVWDVWQLESPNMIWYFRGAPHVHTWVHVKEPVKT